MAVVAEAEYIPHDEPQEEDVKNLQAIREEEFNNEVST